MSRDKQIEELGNEIFNRCSAGLFEDEANAIADFVINKQGYRKASEVALEVIAEIEKINEQYCTTIASTIIKMKLAELKKKYTENKGE